MLLKSTIHLCFAMMFILMPNIGFAQDDGTPEGQSEESAKPVIGFYVRGEDRYSFFNAKVEPGQSVEFAVVLGNDGEIDFEAVTYAADAYSMRNGGFGVKGLEDATSGPTEWLDYPTETFLLEAGQTNNRDFTVDVPEGTPPGEYVTAIAMQTANPVNEVSDDGMFVVNQLYRTVIPIRIEVPGNSHVDLSMGEPQYVVEGTIPAIIVPVTNSGTMQTAPLGDLEVLDFEGAFVLSAPIQMGPIYGGHETYIWLGLTEPLPAGGYQISVILEDEDKGVRAELPNTALTVTEADGKTEAEQPSITFTTASAEPIPAADSVQFLAVDATITNTTEEPIANAQLSLIATVDGEEVERFPISQSLSVPPGETEVSTRYIPLTGWTSGEWEFELLLETVEGSGAAVVVDRVPIDIKVTVP